MPNRTATADPARAGLIAGADAVPLEGVSVEADLTDIYARVVVTQRYRNLEDRAIEAVYTFPLDEQAAVCGFEAVVAGVHYAGQVLSRDKAFEKYDDALQEGHGAYLLDEERPDVFVASVGNVPPKGEVLLRITYVTELVAEGRAVRFTLPTTVAPRYAPAEDRTGVGRSAAETLNPPVTWDVPYGLDVTLRITTPGPITTIQSPSHPIALTLAGTRATVTLSQKSAALDRDVVVLVEAEHLLDPHVSVERDDENRMTAALAVCPVFDRTDAPAEIIFVVDRSGSMAGSSIAEVRNALQLCLRSLTVGCRVNIIGFGSNHVSLFDGSREYSEQTLAAASAHVASLEANLGGTEILDALRYVFAQPPVAGLPRTVVVLTDGEVTNTDAVLAEVAAHAGNARVFTFGIGRGASAHLVRGLARAGKGVAEFVYPGERIEPKVLRQFSRLLSPALNDVRVSWGELEATPVVGELPPIFDGERLVAYAFVKKAGASTVSIFAHGPQGDVSIATTTTAGDVSPGRTLATLAARRRIRELEEHPETLRRFGSRQAARSTDAVRAEIVELATRYGLASRETSFVAIERREHATPTELALRRIPIALTSGWGGSDRRVGAGAIAAAGIQSLQLGSLYAGADADFAAPVPSSLARASMSRPSGVIRKAFETLSELRTPKPSAPSAPPSRRPLDEVATLQRADGSWDLTSELADRLGAALEDLRTKQPAIGDDVWATLLALTWLNVHAADQRDEWARLARKAETWLKLTVPAALLERAREEAERAIG